MFPPSLPSRFFAAGVAVIAWTLVPRAAADERAPRPEIVVADAASGCPSAAGAFVAVFDSNRGILLLSAAAFPGGQVVGPARGSKMKVSVPGTSSWLLDHVGSSGGQASLWGARYPFLARRGNGCVSFDKQHWSAEGDLATYLRWLVEEVYLELPEEERLRRPDFRLADRQVRLRIERTGHGPMILNGKEGSTLACRYTDSDRLYLFMPFVLDAPNERLAVEVFYTDGKYFDNADKPGLGWIVTSPEKPGMLTDPPLTIFVEEVSPSASQ